MFACINVSTPRKKIKSMVDYNLIVHKLKNRCIINHYELSMLLFFATILNSSDAKAASLGNSGYFSIYCDNFMIFLEKIGYPTIDAFFQLAKMTKPTIDYVNVKYFK